jgi:hypothetical protein
MNLVSADSPGMRAAHSHSYVLTIVDILMQDRNLLRPTAALLRKYHLLDTENVKTRFEEDLKELRRNRSRPSVDNTVTPPDNVIKLTQTLHDLYHQSDQQKVRYHRGAIVEVLVRKLIAHRYGPNDFCLNSQHFVENYRNITVKEVDVAALSNIRYKLEGYECKVNPAGFEPSDKMNLTCLIDAADEKQYRINVGFVSFESDKVMRIKLAKHEIPNFIELYGLDSVETLQNLSFLID